MDALFINPSIKKETQHPIFNSLIFSSIPFGLGYVAAYLRKENNLEVKILDEVIDYISDNDLDRELSNINEPYIIGISCLTATYSRAIELANKIKLMKREAIIVFGGVHPTVLPEESLATGVVDIVVRNEGETIVKEIYDSIKEGRSFDKIRGISYAKEDKFYHNPARDPIDLNTLPKFPYDLFEDYIKYYSDVGCILTSRGCPFDCIFCSNRIVTGRGYRKFSLTYVIEQLETLIRKYKQKSINFLDDNIIVDKKRFFDLTDAILERGLHREAFFSVQFRGEDISDDTLVQMKKTNFRMLGCGMETSSESLMLLLNKKETVNAIKKGIELAGANRFLTSTTFIFGIPTETRSDRLNSALLSRRLPIDSARFNIAIPYPGTKLFEIAKQENRLHIAHEWKNFNVQYYLFGDDIPYVPSSTTKYSLIFDTMLANLRFYLRFKILMTILFRTDNTGGGVLSFQKRKKRMRTYINLVKIAIFILRRFIYVGVMALRENFYS